MEHSGNYDEAADEEPTGADRVDDGHSNRFWLGKSRVFARNPKYCAGCRRGLCHDPEGGC